MKPINACVVICADSGKVLAMPWKDGKIDESTTLAARPAQYAWIPKLQNISEVQLGNSLAHVAATHKMKLTKHFSMMTNHAPYIPKVALLIMEKPRW